MVKEHPEVGNEGHMVVYFTGAVSEGRAALMLVNKTDVDIKKDLNFSISWSYDGKTILIIKRLAISSKIVVNYPLIQQL